MLLFLLYHPIVGYYSWNFFVSNPKKKKKKKTGMLMCALVEEY